MKRPVVNPILRAVAIQFAASMTMHLAQKYALKGVDAVEYRIHEYKRRRKGPVGFSAPPIRTKRTIGR